MAPFPNNSTEDTVKLSQEGLNIFSGAARKTGGEVSVQKNKWYLLDFTWDPEGKWHLASNKAHISLQTQEGEQPIEIITP